MGGQEPVGGEMEIIPYQRIRLKDGVHLSARIWKPAAQKKRLPAILMMTPYIADEGQPYATFFTRHEYVFVCLDCRGRGNSEGEFLPLEQDGPDGAQVVEWLARQPWCDGRVAMMGGSYRGMVQWQTLKYRPPSLKTIVPTAAVGPGIDFPQPNNIFYSYAAQWLAFVSGRTANTALFGDAPYWSQKTAQLQKEHLPFARLAQLAGSNDKIFSRWLAHPHYNAYWQGLTLSAADYGKINIPVLTITGFFDDDQPGALDYYRKHMQYGRAEAVAQHHVLIGPYNHAGTRHPQKEWCGLTFGDNCLLDMKQVHLEWFDWILKGKKKPALFKKKICYYLMGANEWRWAERLEAPAKNRMNWNLFSVNGRAGDLFHSGDLRLDAPEAEQKPDTLHHDPLRVPVKERYFSDCFPIVGPEWAQAEDVLIFHTPPLGTDLELRGYARLRLYMEMNVPDCDFEVGLFEVKPGGTVVFLTLDFLRARYRLSLTRPDCVKPGVIERYDFHNFYYFARRLEKGSRLRLVVSCINSSYFEKNHCSGKEVATETAKNVRRALIRLYHDRRYPSCLELPVNV